MMNKLDAAVKSLREQLRELDAERRTIEKARGRIEKALVALNADPVKGTGQRASGSGTQSLDERLKHKSTKAVLDVLIDYGDTINADDLKTLVLSQHPGYAESTVMVAASVLVRAGKVEKVGRDSYRLKGAS